MSKQQRRSEDVNTRARRVFNIAVRGELDKTPTPETPKKKGTKRKKSP